ncbi:hypothetical protein LEP1GSC077_4385 [Leptospira interrogans str. C10069]|uniref:Uncharacterized protein n=1 Tax=Leptospira interrogans serovar Pyrogenes str. 200701872 TaxID=1193029 RepID=M7A2J3_LEPIR|nr:hypothetical protein LEP1GSC077_4385 [Leptospira interrogans str. C10069]EMN62505.1 hypothetical protein LEP1GSC092_2644 [Leptospira interrogans serovar Pyrogenes str. R168]EMP04944.1 hypothetical protein LEP1GSC124_4934 [Leptospira interrogans serovar Pyrogenes str. 200701872]
MVLKKNETLQTKNFRPNGPIFFKMFQFYFFERFSRSIIL